VSQIESKVGKLVVIAGTTASGKTGLALRLARHHGGIILSCDSVCFYRGMDIGSAKPTPGERAEVPHYGIDLVDCCTSYSIGDYIRYRDQILQQHGEAAGIVYVVGGSGFYLHSFFRPQVDGLEVPREIWRKVEQLEATGGYGALVEQLQRLHDRAEDMAGLDLCNPVRVRKALARCLASGRSYRELRAALAAQPEPLPQWDKRVLLLDRSSAEMEARNRQRVAAMFSAGLVDEVRRLREAGLERNPAARSAIGYAEVLQLLDGKLDEEQAREAIVVHTRQLMRKQRTWFRRYLAVDEVVSGDELPTI
jgi:tRNA dimethylallyltransferase